MADRLREEMDAWVKQINRQYSELAPLLNIVEEHSGNIQHNYELLFELRDMIEEMKQDINAIKLIQIIALKQKGIEKPLMEAKP